jgi:hypothetical protein
LAYGGLLDIIIIIADVERNTLIFGGFGHILKHLVAKVERFPVGLLEELLRLEFRK